MKKEYLVIAAAIGITGIAYYLWKSSKPKATTPTTPTKNGKNIVTDKGYPLSIDVSKVNIQIIDCDQAPCPQAENYYGKYYIFSYYEPTQKINTYTLSDGSSGGLVPLYDARTGELIAYNFNLGGHTITEYFSNVSNSVKPNITTEKHNKLGDEGCAEDEVEEAIPCLIAPCPSMCVKKTGFTGGTGSFFNPIRGRNQDTSF